jgi:enoyl-CoA hydratase/carnithine racemase
MAGVATQTWTADRVAHVRLDRPERHNAIDLVMARELLSIMKALAAASDVRCIVLGGVGPSFCAGGDVDEIRACTVEDTLALNRTVLAAVGALDDAPAPSIAALHGNVLGGGLEIALGATLRVCAHDARLGLPEVTLGIVPGAGGVARLARTVGAGAAARLLLTGEMIAADEAHALGLVDRVVAAGELDAAVGELAGRIAANAPLAVQAVHRALRERHAAATRATQASVAASLEPIMRSADAREGLAAFAQRRAPDFHGH